MSIVARHHSNCPRCGKGIDVGHLIKRDRALDAFVHAFCPTAMRYSKALGTPETVAPLTAPRGPQAYHAGANAPCSVCGDCVYKGSAAIDVFGEPAHLRCVVAT